MVKTLVTISLQVIIIISYNVINIFILIVIF